MLIRNKNSLCEQPHDFQVNPREKDRIRILDLRGPLVRGDSEAILRREIAALAEARFVSVVLNLADVTEIDNDGLGALVFCSAWIVNSGGALKLLNLNSRHLSPTILTKLERLFEVFTDEQDAINSFFPDRAVRRYDILEWVQAQRTGRKARVVARQSTTPGGRTSERQARSWGGILTGGDGTRIKSLAGLVHSDARAARVRRSTASSIVLLAFLFAATGFGQQSSLIEQTPRLSGTALTVEESAPALAFSRYLASIQERNPFTESGPVEVEIEASLPGLAKEGSMLAIRQTGASERSEYRVIRLDGDSTVKHHVIARYLDAQEQAEALPYSAVAVTPANYKFRYASSLDNNGTAVYIFQIAPKRKRAGLIKGQIWIDSATGIAVHQVGRFVKRPSVFIRRIEVTRDTNLRDGLPYTRVTHVAIETPLVGRAELTITERPLRVADQPEVAQQLTTPRNAR
jgi:anti-sigma B factor antagonist